MTADLPLPDNAITEALVAAFPKMYPTPDPANESTLVVFTADDGGSAMRALTFGEIAKALARTYDDARAQGAAAERGRYLAAIKSLTVNILTHRNGPEAEWCPYVPADTLTDLLEGTP